MEKSSQTQNQHLKNSVKALEIVSLKKVLLVIPPKRKSWKLQESLTEVDTKSLRPTYITLSKFQALEI